MGGAPAAAAEPLSADEFATRLDTLGPFEAQPHLAVAVSGGADSLALALLADGWARARGGQVTALTVDHRLRPESAAEAAQVGVWLGARGIGHQVIAWTGPKPAAGVQAAARVARRELLASYCRDSRILHLLLAHQAEDQAETVVLRLVAESGPDGLAGMSPVVELAELRLLRPLLDVPRARLAAMLAAAGQGWIDDPSNRDPRFARSAVRRVAGSTDEALAASARYGRERAAREAQTAALLARAAVVAPGGWVELDSDALRCAPEVAMRRALTGAVMAVGGLEYPPRGERAERLCRAVRRGEIGGGRTLGGCRVLRRGNRLLVVREAAAMAAPLPVAAPGRHAWDHRFVVEVGGCRLPRESFLGGLGDDGWKQVVAADKSLKKGPIPAAARAGLPALWDLDGVREVPHLLYRRRDADPDSVRLVAAVFRPRHVLAGAGFAAQ